jgi:hypothetical protein
MRKSVLVAGGASFLGSHLCERLLAEGHQILCLDNFATGSKLNISLPELHPQNPINPYGFSKLVVERILTDLSLSHRFRSISLRYFNAAGADPYEKIGEERSFEWHLIPLVLQTALGSRLHITVFGMDYDTPDGTCVRDYVHVTDRLSRGTCVCPQGSSRQQPLCELQSRELQRLFSQGGDPNRKCGHWTQDPRKRRLPPARRSSAAGGRCDPSQKRAWVKPQYYDLNQIIQTAWNWMVQRSSISLPTAEGLCADGSRAAGRGGTSARYQPCKRKVGMDA